MWLIAALVGYGFVWLLIPRKTTELPEAHPYTFERDKPVENANETFEAWAKLRSQIDVEKREGGI